MQPLSQEAVPALPQPGQLQSPPGQWVEVRGALSQPTSPNGDWKAYPHLASKDTWKRLMLVRAGEFGKFCEARSIWPECEPCKAAGRGMRADFGNHVAGPFHFRDLGRLLPDGQDVAAARGRFWQATNVPGGAIRFNHADGSIELCRGQPLEGQGPGISMAAGAVGVGAAPAPGGADSAEAPMKSLAELTETDRWVMVSPHVGEPTERNGDFEKCPFFYSRGAWKAAMAAPAKKVTRLLNGHNVWPECPICATGIGFEDHVPAAKHLDLLKEKHLRQGVPITTVANSYWQQWNVPGGAVRFNHIHGRIELWRGVPPRAEGTLVRAGSGPAVVGSPTALPAPVGGVQAVAPAGAPPPWNMQPAPAPVSQEVPGAVAPWPGQSSPPGAAQQLPAEQLQPRAAPAARTPADLPEADSWFQLCPPAGCPTRLHGDYTAYPHMQSRHTWKAAMSGPAKLVCNILESQRPPIWPECSVCDRCRGFEEHLPADKHFRAVYDKYLSDGKPVDSVREACWQQWLFRGGAVRYNHVDGAVEMCRMTGADVPSSRASAAQPPRVELPPGPPLIAPVAPPPPPPWPPAPEAGTRPPLQQWSQQEPAVARPPAAPEAAPPPAPAAPGAGQAAAESDLCMWLWREHFADAAERAAEQIREAGVPAEQLVCQVCNGLPMRGGVAEHLLSPVHVRHVALAAGFGVAADTAVKPEVIQYFELSHGRCFALTHCPLRTKWVEGSPAVDNGRQAPPPSRSASSMQADTTDDAPTQTTSLQWTRKRNDKGPYWERSDGEWFVEGSPDWKPFQDPKGLKYYWNDKTGNWFYESGRDMGIWWQ